MNSINNKKCLVLDLDNTLWGGVVGEVGTNGIDIGFEIPGSYFLAFQQAVLDLYDRGIILAINSKNNLKDVIDVFNKNPNMVLKEKHFAAMRVNWNDKTDNMRELAQELNISLDTIVFLDDDSVNRSFVQQVLPEVETPELPENPRRFAEFLMELPYFLKKELTNEDKMRGNMYITERLRRKAESEHTSSESFFKNLDLKAMCALDDSSCIERLSQLTEKTNQFNTNKVVMTKEEIMDFVASPNHAVFHISARDVYGDYGVIGFALVSKSDDIWSIESLLMSCRALGRGIEEAFISMIAENAKEDGVRRLVIVFNETEKNIPAKIFVERYFDNFVYDLNKGPIDNWVECSWKN